MKKLFTAVILILSLNAAQAVSYDEQKLLYMTMHSSIMLTTCGYPGAAWELTDTARTLGHQLGYTDLQLAQLHKKIVTQAAYVIQLQGGLRDVDCDTAVNFHAYTMRLQNHNFQQ